VDAFAAALAEAGVELHLGAQVTRFVTRGAGFDVFTENNNPSLHADRLVLAAGGKAYPNLGSRGELFPQLEKMGHTLLPLRPALAPVLAEMGAYQRLQGVRLDVLARLYEGHALLGKTSGNLIFTEWGVNGPAVMDLSHLISARPDADLRLSLNLMGENEAALRALVEHKRHSATPLKVVLQSVLPPKLAVFFIERAGLPTHGTLNQLTDRSVESLLSQVEDLSLKVKGVRGFEYCQVTAGGVPLGEVNPLTMESSHVSGLYLAGETLDVVGPCGGYNLQFAFTSGALAGRAAGQL
jgi:predicted Rossmann fold flavoprotein